MRRAHLVITLGLLGAAGLLWLLATSHTQRVAPTDASPASPPTAPQPAPAAAAAADAAAVPAHERAVVEAFTVLVRDPAGAPIAGATAALSGDAPREATTGADGQAAFPVSDHAADLRVSAVGFLPVTQHLEQCTGTHIVTLGAGEILEGIVEVDGRPPAEPIEMTLHTAGTREKHTLVTGERGAFTVRGLSPDWSGRLEFPWLYWVLEPPDGERWLPVPAPQRGMRVSLTQLPCLRARLLQASDGTPLGDARVHAVVVFTNGLQTPLASGRVDEQGRLAVRLVPSSSSARVEWLDPTSRAAVAAATLHVDGPNVPATKFEFRGDQIPPDLDLGDLRLVTGVELWIRVEDIHGAPVAGALLQADGKSAKRTDADGVTQVLGESRTPRLWAAALGFRFGPVTASRGSGTREDPFIVTLATGSLLVVRARDAAGKPLRCNVRIEGRGWRIPEHARSIYGLVQLTSAQSNQHTGISSLTMNSDAGGEVRIPGLAPDVEITAAVVDAIDAVLVEAPIRTPSEQETRVVELTVPTRGARVAGIVLDTAGEPAKGAQVSLQHAKRGWSTTTDEAGRFEFEGIHAVGQVIAFRIQHAGHADAVRPPAPLESDLDLRFDLQRGYTLEVAIVDALGRPVDGGVNVRAPDYERSITRLGAGVYRVERVPAGVHEFVASVGNKDFPVRHDPVAGNLRIEVPPAGEVDIDVDATSGDQEPYLRVTLMQDDVVVERLHARRAGSVYRCAPNAVLAGRYTAILKRGDTELSRREIEVVAGQRTTIR